MLTINAQKEVIFVDIGMFFVPHLHVAIYTWLDLKNLDINSSTRNINIVIFQTDEIWFKYDQYQPEKATNDTPVPQRRIYLYVET